MVELDEQGHPKDWEAMASFHRHTENAFPVGLMSAGLARRIQTKVRKKIRDIGFLVEFSPRFPARQVIEDFAVACITRLQACYGSNPWFYAVIWPQVLGAAACSFWPDMLTPEARWEAAATVTMQVSLGMKLKDDAREVNGERVQTHGPPSQRLPQRHDTNEHAIPDQVSATPQSEPRPWQAMENSRPCIRIWV